MATMASQWEVGVWWKELLVSGLAATLGSDRHFASQVTVGMIHELMMFKQTYATLVHLICPSTPGQQCSLMRNKACLPYCGTSLRQDSKPT